MDLRFVVLPGRSSLNRVRHPESRDLYESAYRTFHSVWEETFRQVRDPSHRQHSDDFTRQDLIEAIFDGDRCIALTCIRKADITSSMDLHDSWFADWPAATLRELAEESSWGMVNSHFTVDPDHRRTTVAQDLPVSYLLACFTALHQAAMNVPLMFGMSRRDRSVHTLVEKVGGASLGIVEHNGIKSDLIVFRLETVRSSLRSIPPLVSNLYERTLNLTEQSGDIDE